jgi:hypothetical protein
MLDATVSEAAAFRAPPSVRVIGSTGADGPAVPVFSVAHGGS